jgi:hypothetical protein
MYLLAFCAIIAIASMFFPDVPGITPIYQNLASWISILIGFVFVPATLSLIIRLVRSVQKRQKKWYFDAWTLIVMAITFLVYLSGQSLSSTQYTWLFETLYVSCQAAIWGIMACWLIYVPTQSFIFKKTGITIFALSALIVALGVQAPIGAAIWSGLPVIGKWLVDYPNNAVNWALGALNGIGGLMIGLRIIRGKEKGLIA